MPDPTPRPVPRGPDLPGDVLDALANPAGLGAPDVLAESRAWWRRHADPEDQGEASPVDPEVNDDAP